MIRGSFDNIHTKILDCGKKHFLKNGFEKASLRDICKDAGVTTGAFYRHFNDKNELFEAIVSPVANKIIDNFVKYEKISIDGIRTRPYSPWQNGVVERSHKIDNELFYSRRRFKSEEEIYKSFKRYSARTNNIARRVLGFKTPNEMVEDYFKGVA